MNKGWFFYLAGALAVLVITGIFVGDILWLVDPPSLLLVLSITFLVMGAGRSFKELRSAYRCALTPEKADKEERESAAAFFRCLGLSFLGTGLMGTIIGTVAVLANLADPAKVGQGLSIALLTSLYGLAFALIFALPFYLGVRKKS
jgi:hypothetical protein